MKVLFGSLILVSLQAQALEPIQVSRSVYFVRGDTGLPSSANRGFTSNAGFVITGEGVVVFDTLGTPVLGAELLASSMDGEPLPLEAPLAAAVDPERFRRRAEARERR